MKNIIHSNTRVTKAEQIVIQTVAKLDCSALGGAIGIILGLGIFLATNFLILKGGYKIGLTLSLLNQYFWGYSVTLAGSFVGLIYGFISGFIIGWTLALFRNVVISIYIHIAKFKGRLRAVNFIDY